MSSLPAFRVLRRGIAILGCIPLCALAEKPELQVGTASACPSVYARQDGHAESAADLLTTFGAGLATELVTNLAEALSAYLSNTASFERKAVHRVPALFVASTDNKTDFGVHSQARCIWIALADEFGPRQRDASWVRVTAAGVTTTAESQAWAAERVPFLSEPDKRTNVLEMTGARTPLRFYMEGVLLNSMSLGVWTFVPSLVYYPRYVGGSSWLRSEGRDLSLTLQILRPGPVTDAPLASFNLLYSALQEGELSTATLGNVQVGWSPVPSATPPGDKGGGSTGFFPVTLTAQLVETSKPNLIASTFSKVLTANKESLAKEAGNLVTSALSADARSQAQQTKIDAAEAAATAYADAYTAAIAAQADYVARRSRPADPATAFALNKARAAYANVKLKMGLASSLAARAQLPFTPGPALPPLE